MKNQDKIEAAIKYDRDYEYDFFGFKTLERAYLLKIDGKIVERPQHMLMRVSIGKIIIKFSKKIKHCIYKKEFIKKI